MNRTKIKQNGNNNRGRAKCETDFRKLVSFKQTYGRVLQVMYQESSG